jgi:hypothetical protein
MPSGSLFTEILLNTEEQEITVVSPEVFEKYTFPPETTGEEK